MGAGNDSDAHEHEDRNSGAEEQGVDQAQVGALLEQEEVGEEPAESAGEDRPEAGRRGHPFPVERGEHREKHRRVRNQNRQHDCIDDAWGSGRDQHRDGGDTDRSQSRHLEKVLLGGLAAEERFVDVLGEERRPGGQE